jgi:hypothetical protein
MGDLYVAILTWAVFAVLPALVAGAAIVSARKRREALRGAAARLGFRYEPGDFFSASGTVKGEAGPFRVGVTNGADNEGSGTRIDVYGVDPAITLGIRSGEGVQLGDPLFDASVSGPARKVLALMNRSAREKLAGLRVQVERGRLRYQASSRIWDSGKIADMVGRLVDVAKCLVLPPGGEEHAIAGNAIADPAGAVRQRNMRFLVERVPGSPETLRAAVAVQGDADPELRLLAATVLDEDRALEILRGIVKDGGAPGSIRVAALEKLNALRDPLLLGVASAAAASADAGLARVAARTLVSLGDSASEPALIALLAHESAEVRMEAADGLARTGTVLAVEPLLQLTKGAPASTALKEAARAAIHAIQSRLGEVEAGRLSLAAQDEHDGALSLASEGGEVSVAPADEAATGPNARVERARGAAKGRG